MSSFYRPLPWWLGGVRETSSDAPVDILEELRHLVDGNGEVLEEYGGFAIRILDERRFPWPEVCQYLLRLSHEVWIERRGDGLYLVSKPSVD